LSYSYRDLIAWQKAKELAVEVYLATKNFPTNEMYGLTSQMRRAAVSVPSNIAEGQGRATSGEFVQFLGHARGSLLELETQVAISRELGLLSQESHSSLMRRSQEVLKIINGLSESLTQRSKVRSNHSKHETRNSKLNS
jgi:four helix bundle protein